MIVTMDNLDGNGPVDYTGVLCAQPPLAIARTLNAPSKCTGALEVGTFSTLLVPVRLARVVVRSDAGTVLFTGYLTTEPAPIYVGVGIAGPVYRSTFAAISDEWLLDKQTLTLSGASFAASGASILEILTNRVDAGLLSTSSVSNGQSIGFFEPKPAQPWSKNAAAIADSIYCAYRVLDSALILEQVGSVTHTVDFDYGGSGATLEVASLRAGMTNELANDITLSGEIEPAAYVTELFVGDGTTSVFAVSEEPFCGSAHTLVSDSFNGSSIDTKTWTITDRGSYLSQNGQSLALSRGTGFDNETSLSAIDRIEMGGALILEVGSIELNSLSDGILCGLYPTAIDRANCLVGYNVRQSGADTVITPFVTGAEVGTTFTILQGHAYTLRIRLHSTEMHRVLQSYYARVSGQIVGFGGGEVASPMNLVFDLQDLGSPDIPSTVLYDGSIVNSPACCTFAPVDSIDLAGSISSCTATQTGSAWVVSTPPGGATRTRLIGAAGEGVDCKVSSAGEVTFFSGHVPTAGEIIAITYRTSNRAVARLQDAASIADEGSRSGIPGTARWLGKVIKPVGRCSADCESAIQAALSFSTSRAAAIAGSYTSINPASETDIWPGDVLKISANGQVMNVVTRRVIIENGNAIPELVTYGIAFANDWAESLGLTLSDAIAPDAFLPQTASVVPGSVLANLRQLSIISATGTTLQIDTGTIAPVGGGFEVRLRDWDFGTGSGQGLVLRSPHRSFSITRSAQVERYYIRMYDGSTPPVYSRLSSAVFTNLPIS